PEDSPLLHAGIVRERSRWPHPEVGRRRGAAGWRPVFHGEGDARFKQAADWIRNMYRPRPDYPIEYEPPTPQSLIPPATAPVER
ncbi:MAG: hypothetical protein AAF235_11850, partial [Planctomycetota bacterium]